MRVLNVHERVLAGSLAAVGALIDGLASPEDALWPRDRWPAMRFDRPLQVGARGGHGPIRYSVAAYRPGRYIEFRFHAPRGFNGYHAFLAEPVDEAHTRLRHVLAMHASGLARLSWPLAFRPLHNALIEDALDRACQAVGMAAAPPHWSAQVVLLRRIFQARRAARRATWPLARQEAGKSP